MTMVPEKGWGFGGRDGEAFYGVPELYDVKNPFVCGYLSPGIEKLG